MIPEHKRYVIVHEDDIQVEDLSNFLSAVQKFGITAPQVLYIPFYLMALEHTGSTICFNSFETFHGEDVQLFDQAGKVQATYFKSLAQLIERSRFSNEEIDRYQATRVHQSFEFKARPDYEPFVLLQRMDPAAEAIAGLGNQYFKENGFVPPTPGALRHYMIENANKPWEVIDRPNDMRHWIQIEGIPMSYDSFRKRFKSLLEDSGR